VTGVSAFVRVVSDVSFAPLFAAPSVLGRWHARAVAAIVTAVDARHSGVRRAPASFRMAMLARARIACARSARQLDDSATAHVACRSPVMKTHSKLLCTARRRIPFFPVLPLVPIAFVVTTTVALVRLFRRVRRLEDHTLAA
jgi:hypothetical protein